MHVVISGFTSFSIIIRTYIYIDGIFCSSSFVDHTYFIFIFILHFISFYSLQYISFLLLLLFQCCYFYPESFFSAFFRVIVCVCVCVSKLDKIFTYFDGFCIELLCVGPDVDVRQHFILAEKTIDMVERWEIKKKV